MRRAIGRLAIVAMAAVVSLPLHAQERRDPTEPLSWQQNQSSVLTADHGLKLNGIRFSESTQYAIINGQQYQEGDRVEGFRVYQILPNAVELRNASGQRLNLQLFRSLKQVLQEDEI